METTLQPKENDQKKRKQRHFVSNVIRNKKCKLDRKQLSNLCILCFILLY